MKLTMQKTNTRTSCLHMEVFEHFGVDERTLANHSDSRSENLKIARELIKIARMLLEE